MPDAQPRRRRRALLWGLAVLALLLLALLLFPRRKPPPAVASETPAAAAHPTRGTASRGGSAPAGALAGVPIIDEITLEKSEVCEGEENLVSVRAHMPGGVGDAQLNYLVGGEPGQSVPVFAWLPHGTEPRPPKMVVVYGPNESMTTAPVPPYEVKPCQPSRRLHVTARLLPNTVAEYEIQALVRNVTAGDRFKPVRYLWEFGDGTRFESESEWVRHDYTLRPQTTLYSWFLLRVEAVSASGERVVGRKVLTMMNHGVAEELRRGVILIQARLTPRYSEPSPDGKARHQVLLFHHYTAAAVIIDRVVASIQDGFPDKPPVEGGKELVPEEPPRREETHDPMAILRLDRVPAAGVETQVALDYKAQPKVNFITYEIYGHTEDGKPAEGSFTIFQPRPPLKRGSGVRLADPVLAAKIQVAQQVLDRQQITDDDMARLENAGVFVGFEQALNEARVKAGLPAIPPRDEHLGPPMVGHGQPAPGAPPSGPPPGAPAPPP
ncbi:MAG TPA: hypothetical protein VGQ83_24125 [Polyangia bacterium]|jgi:hypothetical protein